MDQPGALVIEKYCHIILAGREISYQCEGCVFNTIQIECSSESGLCCGWVLENQVLESKARVEVIGNVTILFRADGRLAIQQQKRLGRF